MGLMYRHVQHSVGKEMSNQAELRRIEIFRSTKSYQRYMCYIIVIYTNIISVIGDLWNVR